MTKETSCEDEGCPHYGTLHGHNEPSGGGAVEQGAWRAKAARQLERNRALVLNPQADADALRDALGASNYVLRACLAEPVPAASGAGVVEAARAWGWADAAYRLSGNKPDEIALMRAEKNLRAALSASPQPAPTAREAAREAVALLVWFDGERNEEAHTPLGAVHVWHREDDGWHWMGPTGKGGPFNTPDEAKAAAQAALLDAREEACDGC